MVIVFVVMLLMAAMIISYRLAVTIMVLMITIIFISFTDGLRRTILSTIRKCKMWLNQRQTTPLLNLVKECTILLMLPLQQDNTYTRQSHPFWKRYVHFSILSY